MHRKENPGALEKVSVIVVQSLCVLGSRWSGVWFVRRLLSLALRTAAHPLALRY